VIRAGGSGGNIWLQVAVMAGASNLLLISGGMGWNGEGRWVVWTTMMTNIIGQGRRCGMTVAGLVWSTH